MFIYGITFLIVEVNVLEKFFIVELDGSGEVHVLEWFDDLVLARKACDEYKRSPAAGCDYFVCEVLLE